MKCPNCETVKCPLCNAQTDFLSFNVTATCGSQLFKDTKADYDLSCLTENVEFDDFSCPECNEVIAFTEDEAIKFLKGENGK